MFRNVSPAPSYTLPLITLSTGRGRRRRGGYRGRRRRRRRGRFGRRRRFGRRAEVAASAT